MNAVCVLIRFGDTACMTVLSVRVSATTHHLRMPKFNLSASMPFDSPSKCSEWRERFSRFRIATKLHNNDGDIQVSSYTSQNMYKLFWFLAHPATTGLCDHDWSKRRLWHSFEEVWWVFHSEVKYYSWKHEVLSGCSAARIIDWRICDKSSWASNTLWIWR